MSIMPTVSQAQLKREIPAKGLINAMDVAVFISQISERLLLRKGMNKPLTVGMLELIIYCSQGASLVLNGAKLFPDSCYAEAGTVKIEAVSAYFGYRARTVVVPPSVEDASRLCVGPRTGFITSQMITVGSTAEALLGWDENRLKDCITSSAAYKKAMALPSHEIRLMDMKNEFLDWYNNSFTWYESPFDKKEKVFVFDY